MDIERLTVKVHLLGEPCLWCWEIVDVEDDALVESSWATEWTGYASSRRRCGPGPCGSPISHAAAAARLFTLGVRRQRAKGTRRDTSWWWLEPRQSCIRR